jgi:hypothetical protein
MCPRLVPCALAAAIAFGCGADGATDGAGASGGKSGAGSPPGETPIGGKSGAGSSSGGAPSGGSAGGDASGGASGAAAASATGGSAGSAGLPQTGGTSAGGGNAGSGGMTGTGGTDAGGAAGAAPVDPGSGPWVRVPVSEVAATCRLDPQKLGEADAALPGPWAIVRYGKLCYESADSETMLPGEAWSTTKTFGALVSGFVAYQTKAIPRTGRKTGPFSDQDRVDHWLDAFAYNQNALVAHVLAMVAHNPNLSLGQKPMVYDTVGTTQINSVSDMLNAAIAQDAARLGSNLEAFTQRFVYAPLGMTQSSWSSGAANKTFAFTWSTTVRDMARVGLLMLHGGTWNGQRLLDEEWIYRMTHPAFEDSNTGYGYLTWLNASSNHHFGGIPGAPIGLQQKPYSPGPCAPVSVFRSHPHPPSDAPNCNYAAAPCDQALDVGVWQAVGLGGQVIQGHPGLDLVVVARNVTPVGSGPDAPGIVWNAVKGAVVAGDPQFAGNEAAFCQAYGSNSYAPDL